MAAPEQYPYAYSKKFLWPSLAPFVRVQPNITTATTTILVAASAGKTVKIYRVFLNIDATQTIDIQDTAGTTLVGGALAYAANGGIVFDFLGEPWFVTTSGLGFQFVTSTTGKVRGFIDYVQS